MRRGTALALVAVALALGSATGLTAAHEVPRPGSSPAPSAPAPTPTPATRTPGPSGTASGSVSGVDLVRPRDLDAAGWGATTGGTSVRTDEQDPEVSPCQRPGPFTGLGRVVTGRWQGPGGRAGEVIADAPSVQEAQRRAEDLYEQHRHCAELEGRTVGARHAVPVDGGSVTWFEVSDRGTEGFASVLRQSDRFAVVYLDRSKVSEDGLTELLRRASDELR